MATAILSDLLAYSEKSPSGLVWAVDRGYQAKAGQVAGWLDPSTGYYRVGVLRKTLWAHRVVWELSRGEIPVGHQIDHVNGDRADNRVENLRLASHSENKCNVHLRPDNASGVKGLYWHKTLEIWMGEVRFQGRRMTKSSRDRSIVERWLIDTREKEHGEYVRHE
ncbi:HNH endonuclease [Pseudomonas aeruginosa]